MNTQLTFASAEYAAKKRITRREVFLAQMEKIVPWAKLVAVIAPVYPKGERGRAPLPLERMLRVYFLQQWYGLSDEALEDSLYDSASLARFAGVSIGHGQVPDATTVLKFRRLIETHALAAKFLQAINADLEAKGILMRKGSIVDATLIAAPCSTKNAAKSRDSEMHSVKKGNQWYFGMKAHIGVDAQSGLVHTVTATAANVADVTEAHKLLHGQESTLHADAGYVGLEQREEMSTPEMKAKELEIKVARKRGGVKKLPEGPHKDALIAEEKKKAQIRAIVEHPFHVVKNLFHYKKARYVGLAKNASQQAVLFALANLVIAKRKLQALWEQSVYQPA